MKYYKLLPEVPGQLGEKTIIVTTCHPPIIEHLHFVFDGWLGDHLLECFPCFLISDPLYHDLKKTKINGFEIKELEYEYSELFIELHSIEQISNFLWLVVTGKKGDDFFIDENNYLFVSDKCINVLQSNSYINNCEIEEVLILL